MADTREPNHITASRPVRVGMMTLALSLSALAIAPFEVHAASVAHTIPAPAGEGVRIITPPRLAVRPIAPASRRLAGDSRMQGERRQRPLPAVARPDEAPQQIILRIERPILVERLPYCQRGLFGRLINAPCRDLLDATFPQGR